ncbi:unnamed protein product, partial [Symbiodinium necroappetens]
MPSEAREAINKAGFEAKPSPPPGLQASGKDGGKPGKGKGKGKGSAAEPGFTQDQQKTLRGIFEGASESQKALLQLAGLEPPEDEEVDLEELCRRHIEELPQAIQEAVAPPEPDPPSPQQLISEASRKLKAAAAELREVVFEKASLQLKLNSTKDLFEQLLNEMKDLNASMATKQEQVAELQKELERQLPKDGENEKVELSPLPMEVDEVLDHLGIVLNEEQVKKLSEMQTRKRPRLEASQQGPQQQQGHRGGTEGQGPRALDTPGNRQQQQEITPVSFEEVDQHSVHMTFDAEQPLDAGEDGFGTKPRSTGKGDNSQGSGSRYFPLDFAEAEEPLLISLAEFAEVKDNEDGLEGVAAAVAAMHKVGYEMIGGEAASSAKKGNELDFIITSNAIAGLASVPEPVDISVVGQQFSEDEAKNKPEEVLLNSAEDRSCQGNRIAHTPPTGLWLRVESWLNATAKAGVKVAQKALAGVTTQLQFGAVSQEEAESWRAEILALLTGSTKVSQEQEDQIRGFIKIAQVEHLAQDKQRYQDWIEGAMVKSMRPLYKAIRSHEQVLVRPFRNKEAALRPYLRSRWMEQPDVEAASPQRVRAPGQWRVVKFAMLAKNSAIERPIGVTCLSVSTARVFKCEVAVATGRHRATLYLDLSTFYETLSHAKLIESAKALAFPASVLNIAIQIYRGGRIMEAEGTMSPVSFTDRGVIAGCPAAPALSKLALYRPLKIVQDTGLTAGLDSWIDDVTIDAEAKDAQRVAQKIVALYRTVSAELGNAELQISTSKSAFVCTDRQTQHRVQQLLRTGEPPVLHLVKDLGVDSAGARRRRVATSNARIAKATGRSNKLSKLKIPNQKKRAATGVFTAATFGRQGQGISPKRMKMLRAIAGGHYGKLSFGSLDLVFDLSWVGS